MCGSKGVHVIDSLLEYQVEMVSTLICMQRKALCVYTSETEYNQWPGDFNEVHPSEVWFRRQMEFVTLHLNLMLKGQLRSEVLNFFIESTTLGNTELSKDQHYDWPKNNMTSLQNNFLIWHKQENWTKIILVSDAMFQSIQYQIDWLLGFCLVHNNWTQNWDQFNQIFSLLYTFYSYQVL